MRTLRERKMNTWELYTIETSLSPPPDKTYEGPQYDAIEKNKRETDKKINKAKNKKISHPSLDKLRFFLFQNYEDRIYDSHVHG